MSGLRTVDVSREAHLSGRFAPVEDELDAVDLTVEGRIPADLTGLYVRNGPNPRFTPLGSYTYPIEGDGMLHGVWLEAGRARRYRNRWVLTKGLEAEVRAGRALFGGLATPALVDPALLGPDPDPGWPIKLDAFINIVRHAGRYLALEEGTPPYEVSAELETIGRYDFGGGLPLGLCAHPRLDPATGELVVFRYDVEAPFLTWATIGADGAVTGPPRPVDGVDEAFMIHDFTITPTSVVLVVAPTIIDLSQIGHGDVIRWDGERPTRIAVIDRSGGKGVRWLETDPFFAWHYANAYDDGDDIVLDFPWWSAFQLARSNGPPVRGGFAHARLQPAAGRCRIDLVDEVNSEFPRIDERVATRAHRYVVTSRKSGHHDLVVGEFDQLARHDLVTGETAAFDADVVFGEVVFAPRDGGAGELDGYYLTFASSPDATRSWLLIWDAPTFPGPPVARVAMPRRVPNGLHGNWFAPA